MSVVLGCGGTMGGVSQTEQQPTTDTPGQEPTEGSRRYPRTFGGLIGSMILLLVIVVPVALLVQWRGNETREIRGGDQPRSADWRAAVTSAASAGITVVHPSSLPHGWYANTDPTYTGGDEPDWTMSFVKGETSYVGIETSTRPADVLARKNIDASPHQGSSVTLTSELATSWTSWSDSGGDHGYSATVDGQTVLVWGPKDADVRRFVSLLTTKPLTS